MTLRQKFLSQGTRSPVQRTTRSELASQAYLDEKVHYAEDDNQNMHESQLIPNWRAPALSCPARPNYEEPNDVKDLHHDEHQLDLGHKAHLLRFF